MFQLVGHRRLRVWITACSLAAGFPHQRLGPICCVCVIGANLTFTLNSAFCGATTFTLNWIDSGSWTLDYTITIDYGPTASDGSEGAFFSNPFTDGTHTYIFVYDGQPVLLKYSGKCKPFFRGMSWFRLAGMSGYQCSPSFTATYTVTSGQTMLYGAGVRTVAVAGTSGQPIVHRRGHLQRLCKSGIDRSYIQVWDHSGGTLLSTLTTNGSGNITVPVGSYWLIPTGGRFAGQTSSIYGAATARLWRQAVIIA